MIVKGLEIDWLQTPPPSFSKGPKFSIIQMQEIDSEVSKMLEKQAIEPVNPTPGQVVSHLFLAPKKDGSKRPVINLKKLNKFIRYQHFKMEGIPTLADIIQPNDYMVKLDLKDAFFSIRVAEKERKFLRFVWRGQLYQFRAAPFGLAPLPRIFTKLLKPAIAFLRRMGIRVAIYLDDLIILHQRPNILTQHLKIAVMVLKVLGFLINWEKSILDPKQVMEYLGFLIDSVKMQFSLPPLKIQDLITQCTDLLKVGQATARTLATVIGKMTAAVRAILPAPLQYRHLQRLKAKALFQGCQSYETMITLSSECRTELQWWAETVDKWNGRSILKPSPDIALTITTDSSMTGWGAESSGVTTQGLWTTQERQMHINVLEMKAVNFAVQAYTKEMRQIHVHLRVDNTTTIAYINKMGGTRSIRMLEVAKELWQYCMSKEIMLTAEHLKGANNQIADRESRIYKDSSNWMLDKSVFRQLERVMGVTHIDLFADRTNTQKHLYVSWKPDPFAIATDAFTITWNQVSYAFPPFCLIGRCLAKIRQDKATVIMVTPIWQTQAWYTELLGLSVEDPIMLPPKDNLLISPTGLAHPLLESGLSLAAWKLSGDMNQVSCYQQLLETYSAKRVDRAQNPLMSHPGRSGLAGVTENRLIRFRPLWVM